MKNFIKQVRKDGNASVAADWLVLTAAVVALLIAAYISVSGGAGSLSSSTATYMNTQQP